MDMRSTTAVQRTGDVMRWVRCGLLVAALVLAAACSSGESTPPGAEPGTPPTSPSTSSTSSTPTSPSTPSSPGELVSRIPPGGTLRVIVTLSGSFVPEGELPDEAARQAQRQAISAGQTAVLDELASTRVSDVRRFTYTPQLALTVDAAALERLLRSRRVAAVQEDTAQSQTG
jgi:hypothetical protein